MENFNVNDIVDVKNRRDIRAYGKIKKIFNDEDGIKKAVVHFRMPKEPKNKSGGWGGSCDSCGWPGFLSVSGNTGEIVCMRSGCGYGHGFEERDEIILLTNLINISFKRKKDEEEKIKKEIKNEINAFLNKGVSKNIINQEDKDKILEFLKKYFYLD